MCMFSLRKSNRAGQLEPDHSPTACYNHARWPSAMQTHAPPRTSTREWAVRPTPPPPPDPSVRACTESIKQRSPSLLVEYRILQDVDNHGEWYEHYFGSSSELSSGIPVSNLSPSTIYEFQVTLIDSQNQEKYFSATTSGCTLPGKLLVMIIFHELGY